MEEEEPELLQIAAGAALCLISEEEGGEPIGLGASHLLLLAPFRRPGPAMEES
jgi:hypothetical protein